MITNLYLSSCKVPVIVRFLMKLEFSWQIFNKYSNIKFRDSPSSGSGMVPCGQTDRTKLTVTLCSCVYVPNNSELGPGVGLKHANTLPLLQADIL